MKAARLIVLGVALAAGGVAAWLASGTRSPEPPKEAAPPPLATVDVLIAKYDLVTGQVISGSDLGWQTWPTASAGNFIKKTDRTRSPNSSAPSCARRSPPASRYATPKW